MLSTANSVNPLIQQDLKQLKLMLEHYEAFEAKLQNEQLENHDRQMLSAAKFMLQEVMWDKTRDIRRRLRESKEY